nr:MAG TPA: Small hydrophobic protein [Caudoviricetes sp.]
MFFRSKLWIYYTSILRLTRRLTCLLLVSIGMLKTMSLRY